MTEKSMQVKIWWSQCAN